MMIRSIRSNSDQCMEYYKKTSSERRRVLESGAEGAAGVGAGGEGLLRMMC